MKKLVLFQLLILIGCNSIQNISNSEREKIISELDYIGKIDQKYAGIPFEELISKYGQEKAWEIFEVKRDSVDLDNQKRIKKLYFQYGYLGFNQVGEENSIKFWLPIQHADNDIIFQKKMLKELSKEVKKNNANKNSYALLEDRIAVNLNKKQRFGTQVSFKKNGQAVPKNGLIDSLNIDKLRFEYNLPTLKDYYNQMTTNHFEMNKKNFLNVGIIEPNLYK